MLLFTPDDQSILFYENKQLVFRVVISGNINHQIAVKTSNLFYVLTKGLNLVTGE